MLTMTNTLDEQTWKTLSAAAVEAMCSAYCPYSHFPVGAAGLTTDGRMVSGCNVENAGYGVTLCAECGMISDLVRHGGGRLKAVAIVNGNGQACAPCGRCRQLIFEHGGNECLILMPTGPMAMSEVLPGAFGPSNLSEVTSGQALAK